MPFFSNCIVTPCSAFPLRWIQRSPFPFPLHPDALGISAGKAIIFKYVPQSREAFESHLHLPGRLKQGCFLLSLAQKEQLTIGTRTAEAEGLKVRTESDGHFSGCDSYAAL